MKHILILAAAVAVAHTSTAAYFADQVLSYSPGTGAGSYTNAGVALGSPAPIVSAGTSFSGVFSPFNPHWETSQIVKIGEGGHLSLQLSHFVTIDRTPGVFEIGVWENVFLADTEWGKAQSSDPAAAFGVGSAIVDVSDDGVTWHSLNSNQPISFSLPGNYFTNAGAYDSAAPANPQYADFGKPFTGSIADFNGENYSQILATLGGSAGGTWLNLDNVPLTQVGYVRFRDVVQLSETSVADTLEIDAVAINTTLAGAPVPEPSAGLLAVLGLGVIGTFRRRRS